MNQSRHGGTVQGSAPRNPAIKNATAGLLRLRPDDYRDEGWIKPWSFTILITRKA